MLAVCLGLLEQALLSLQGNQVKSISFFDWPSAGKVRQFRNLDLVKFQVSYEVTFPASIYQLVSCMCLEGEIDIHCACVKK